MKKAKYIKAVIEYDGTAFSGFQIQPDERTVHGELQRALKKLFNKNIEINYASRTDSGVHARGQVIGFEVPYEMVLYKMHGALNNILSDDVIIREVTESKADFYPRYEAKCKLYKYRILNRQLSDYRLRKYVWYIPKKLNWLKIKESLELMKGEHEFILFSSECEEKNTIINMQEIYIEENDELFEINIKGKYFLTYMIRYMIGFAVAVGKGLEDILTLEEMLEGKGKKCSHCAPAKGLELNQIWFKDK